VAVTGTAIKSRQRNTTAPGNQGKGERKPNTRSGKGAKKTKIYRGKQWTHRRIGQKQRDKESKQVDGPRSKMLTWDAGIQEEWGEGEKPNREDGQLYPGFRKKEANPMEGKVNLRQERTAYREGTRPPQRPPPPKPTPPTARRL